jgi:hypothetical protein
LAAPSFAAAAVGGRVMATVAVGSRVLIVGQGTIEKGSWAEGRSVGQLQQTLEARAILLSDNGREMWRPDPLGILSAGQELVLVTTRRGFARFVDGLETQAS